MFIYVDKTGKLFYREIPSFEIYDKSFDDSVIFTQLKADADVKNKFSGRRMDEKQYHC